MIMIFYTFLGRSRVPPSRCGRNQKHSHEANSQRGYHIEGSRRHEET